MDKYDEIIRFAVTVGIDPNGLGIEDVPCLVETISAKFQSFAASGPSLSSAEMKAWTFNPRNGWLAMVHRR